MIQMNDFYSDDSSSSTSSSTSTRSSSSSCTNIDGVEVNNNLAETLAENTNSTIISIEHSMSKMSFLTSSSSSSSPSSSASQSSLLLLGGSTKNLSSSPSPAGGTPKSTSPSTGSSRTSNLKFLFDRGTDLKFHFGFLKRRNTDGSITKTTKKTKPQLSTSPVNNSSSSNSSVRPTPEEAKKWSQEFAQLMSSKYGQTLFRAFLKREFCDENLEFWLAVEEYRKLTREAKLRTKASKILTTFILPQSPKEINIDSLTRETLIAQILDSKSSSATKLVSIFDIAQKRIQNLLETDAYQRFLVSALYLELLQPEYKYENENEFC